MSKSIRACKVVAHSFAAGCEARRLVNTWSIAVSSSAHLAGFIGLSLDCALSQADSISATFLGKYREIGKPNVPGHVSAVFGDIESVRAVADHETAAIMLEPIQSMVGVTEADPSFFRDLRNMCDELGIVLIFDEVQTGIGRTGNWFFGGNELADGVEPDIITLAKSLGSGVPVGACLVNDRVSENIKLNDLGTTFGGGMLAMAAVVATLEAIEAGDMIKNASSVEHHLRDSLSGATVTLL